MSNLLQIVIYRVSQNYKYGYTSGKFVSCVLLCYYMHFYFLRHRRTASVRVERVTV